MSNVEQQPSAGPGIKGPGMVEMVVDRQLGLGYDKVLQLNCL